jgi:DNA invertase Pin-like site-specific DNA recombinase
LERISRIDKRRRLRLQAAGLFLVLSVEGIVAYALGAPIWIVLYVGLGIGLAWLWLRLGLGRPTRAAVSPPAPEPAQRAVGYVCVNTTARDELHRQTEAIKACCEQRGLELLSVVHDRDAEGRDHRPSLAWALEQLAERRAEALVIARLRDLSANVANLRPLLTWFNEERRILIALDLSIDTSTEAGRIAAEAIADISTWEHDRLSDRTRRGLEAARSRGANGRTSVADIPELQQRIAEMREQGMTLRAIADTLNIEGVPTLRGGAMWRPSSVQRATGYRRPSSGGRGIELPRRTIDR